MHSWYLFIPLPKLTQLPFIRFTGNSFHKYCLLYLPSFITIPASLKIRVSFQTNTGLNDNNEMIINRIVHHHTSFSHFKIITSKFVRITPNSTEAPSSAARITNKSSSLNIKYTSHTPNKLFTSIQLLLFSIPYKNFLTRMKRFNLL